MTRFYFCLKYPSLYQADPFRAKLVLDTNLVSVPEQPV